MGILRFTGTDALTFLQGQISNDTRRLERGEPLLAACSTPQGRVYAVLRLLPHSTGVLALLPSELAAPVAGRLGKYVLRSKVRIEDASDEFAVAGLHGTRPLADAGLGGADLRGAEPVPSERPHPAPDSSDGGGADRGPAYRGPADRGPAYRGPADRGPAYFERDGVGVARVAVAAPAGERYWAVGPAAKLAARGLLDAGDEAAWRLADIADGMPQIYADTVDLFVAQMLNLDLLDGISFKKGCFTGQEIIARTQHLGRIKRRMFRVRLPDAPWRIGGSMQLADGRSGRLTELARSGEGFEALAVLPLTVAASPSDAEPASSAAPVDAATAVHRGTELPLPYALTVPS